MRSLRNASHTGCGHQPVSPPTGPSAGWSPTPNASNRGSGIVKPPWKHAPGWRPNQCDLVRPRQGGEPELPCPDPPPHTQAWHPLWVPSVRGVCPHLRPAIPIFIQPSPSSSSHPHLRPAVPIFIQPSPSSSSHPHLRPAGPPTSSSPSGRTHRTLLASVLFSSWTLVCSLSITGCSSTCYLHPPSIYVSIPGPQS